MHKQVKTRIAEIKAIAKSRNPEEIGYFKAIALDSKEDIKVRLQAVMIIGSFDWMAVSPLTDISGSDEGKVGKTAFRVLHALNAKQYKSGWSDDAKLMLKKAIRPFIVLNEDRMA